MCVWNYGYINCHFHDNCGVRESRRLMGPFGLAGRLGIALPPSLRAFYVRLGSRDVCTPHALLSPA